MLGKLLGDTIKDALGENILDQVETIRKLSKSSRAGNDTHRKELLNTLQNLSNEELLPVARAFSFRVSKVFFSSSGWFSPSPLCEMV